MIKAWLRIILILSVQRYFNNTKYLGLSPLKFIYLAAFGSVKDPMTLLWFVPGKTMMRNVDLKMTIQRSLQGNR